MSSLVVPTVPTISHPVGTEKDEQYQWCPDRPDCPDQLAQDGVKIKGSLGGLLARLRDDSAIEIERTRHVLSNPPFPFILPPDPSSEVGTVGTVGTINNINDLTCPDLGWDGRDSRDTPDWGGEAADDGVADLRWMGLSQEVVVSGLLAASRIRPAARACGDADPWAAGIAELQRMLPLDGFSPDQWMLVQRGCAALLEGWGAEMRRLGWNTADAFGVHPEVPGTAVCCYGLGVLLNGGSVVEMTKAGAKVRCRSGAHQSFTRLAGTGAVPIWTAGKHPLPSSGSGEPAWATPDDD